MTLADLVSMALMAVGGFFFLAGTAGLLRFPDLHARLHALTKVDNLGLGLTGAGLTLQADSWLTALELALIWLVALAASATSSYLLGGAHAAPDRNRQ
jgi:multicomponent Na+:H+ antiporter subunit G